MQLQIVKINFPSANTISRVVYEALIVEVERNWWILSIQYYVRVQSIINAENCEYLNLGVI